MNDDRINHHLSARADAITLAPADPASAIERARQRQRRRRSAFGVAAAAAVAVGTLGLANLDSAPQEVNTPAAGVVPSGLEWTVVDSDPATGLSWGQSTVTTADGTVYGLSTAPGAADPNDVSTKPQTLYRSSDGQRWEAAALPAELYASSLSAEGNTLYAVGTVPAGGGRAVAVASSTGGDWTQTILPIDLQALDAAYPKEIAVSSPLITSGDAGLVAAVGVQWTPDYNKLLAGRHDLDSGAFGIDTTGDGIVVSDFTECMERGSSGRAIISGPGVTDTTIAPANAVDIASSGSDDPEAPASTIVQDGKRCETTPESTTTYTWDQLGVSAEAEALAGGLTYLFTSADGSSFTPVDTPVDGGWISGIESSGPEYVLFANDSKGKAAVYRSTDAQAWTLDTATGINGWVGSTGLLNGRPAAFVSTDDGTSSVKVASPGAGWTTLDLVAATGLQSSDDRFVSAQSVSFGPLGLAAVVTSYGQDGNGPTYIVHSASGGGLSVVPVEGIDAEHWSPSGITVSADAITARFTEVVNGPGQVPAQQLFVGTPAG